MKKRPEEPDVALPGEKEQLVLSEIQQQRRGEKGIECRACGCRRMRVYYTRQGDNSIKRVRMCENCGAPRVTFEKPV